MSVTNDRLQVSTYKKPADLSPSEKKEEKTTVLVRKKMPVTYKEWISLSFLDGRVSVNPALISIINRFNKTHGPLQLIMPKAGAEVAKKKNS